MCFFFLDTSVHLTTFQRYSIGLGNFQKKYRHVDCPHKEQGKLIHLFVTHVLEIANMPGRLLQIRHHESKNNAGGTFVLREETTRLTFSTPEPRLWQETCFSDLKRKGGYQCRGGATMLRFFGFFVIFSSPFRWCRERTVWNFLCLSRPGSECSSRCREDVCASCCCHCCSHLARTVLRQGCIDIAVNRGGSMCITCLVSERPLDAEQRCSIAMKRASMCLALVAVGIWWNARSSAFSDRWVGLLNQGFVQRRFCCWKNLETYITL